MCHYKYSAACNKRSITIIEPKIDQDHALIDSDKVLHSKVSIKYNLIESL